MPKFTVTAEITMRTYLTPYGDITLFHDDVEDFEDESHWNEEAIDIDGGKVSFVMTAESQEDAELRADEILNENLALNASDLEWEFERIDVTGVTPIEEPMTRGRAVEVLRTYLAANRSTTLEPELVRAIEFLLALLAARPHLTTPPVNQEVA